MVSVSKASSAEFGFDSWPYILRVEAKRKAVVVMKFFI
jgi:hypothetical protein